MRIVVCYVYIYPSLYTHRGAAVPWSGVGGPKRPFILFIFFASNKLQKRAVHIDREVDIRGDTVPHVHTHTHFERCSAAWPVAALNGKLRRPPRRKVTPNSHVREV